MKNRMKKKTENSVKQEELQVKNLRQFVVEEEGMGTVEIILIIVVLVGLVMIFRDQITTIVQNIFSKITTRTNKF